MSSIFQSRPGFFAAVVEGARFTVHSDAGGATVEVECGVVQVQDAVHDLVVNVRPGQAATVTEQAPLLVEGLGAVAVFSFEGVPVLNGTATEASAGGAHASGNSASGSAADHAAGTMPTATAMPAGHQNEASSPVDHRLRLIAGGRTRFGASCGLPVWL
ncbi:MAG: hypothetical protein MO852_03200 [Candidatus Devosia euplotis]|nr:hypothetical protein [Candidatus Devosia euplotis]